MIFEIDNIIYIIIKNDYNKKEYFVFNNNDEILDYLLPAYIITIHKSQGSEYKNVLILYY
jgi:ATP-dependent exoDNAse (exonuclease V) alpha subunit